jgi:hypothetical protein
MRLSEGVKTGLLLVSLMLPAGVALADDDGGPRRIAGFGALGGAGFALNSLSGAGISGAFISDATSNFHVAIELPTFEMQFFLDHRSRMSFDISIPLTDTFYIGGYQGPLFWQSDFFLDWNLGHGNVRGVVGPGLGFSVLSGGGGAGSFRLTGQGGLEILTSNHGFGFRLMGRPWLEIVGGGNRSNVGTGLLALIGFNGYVRR